ncbi:hypothetical protein [Mesorhizobium sp. B1-1-8]|uniref:hypothetical protein n=1 Tax=Mesorhizobium sp. B1-1-8 TaxID=2589976 RepID=UPI0015E3E76F|nr:hypothetical protein [Mesorhizobium sp. B1-1-8]UCI10338.1 hypothetical protein FJ974_21210 [Mesorhizobium sp. B1-1-8]
MTVLGEVAAAAPVLALVHIFSLLLATAATLILITVLVALLAGFDMLFVASALIGHVHAPFGLRIGLTVGFKEFDLLE